MTTSTPFMKKFTEEEMEELIDKTIEAHDRGDKDEHRRLSYMVPLPPVIANDLKKSIGIEEILSRGMNLVEAVEAYGEEWLKN